MDNPIDTCGSYKIEEHGLILFESIDCNDFSSIQGLPLIWLSNCLKENGYEFFKK
jgi:septum formation protein